MAISLDNGESVYEHTGVGAADPMAAVNALASSVANLMKNRERFDFTWANVGEQNATSTMVQGSRGLREDIKTEMLFDNGQWRLATPYIEFSGGSKSIPSVYTSLDGWSVDNTRSTDTTMVTVSGNVFTIVRAGLYSLDAFGGFSASSSDQFITWTTDVAHVNFVGIGSPVSSVCQASRAAYRITADNTPLYLWGYSNSSVNITARAVSITRLA